jgi:hypothetical protein
MKIELSELRKIIEMLLTLIAFPSLSTGISLSTIQFCQLLYRKIRSRVSY